MTTSRIQLALNVPDVESATEFYADLFGVGPARQRRGYANYVVADPPLKLVLFENPEAQGPLNHLGWRSTRPMPLATVSRRFAAAGLGHRASEIDTCCHAVQEKIWVDAPDVPLGAWEFYTVLGDAPPSGEAAAGSCCVEDAENPTPCCAVSGGCG